MGKLLMLASTLVTVRLTTTYLGVEGFGEYAVVLAFVPVMLVIADLGLSTLLARELAKTPERRDELAGTLAWFRVAASAAIVVLAGLGALVLPYDYEVRAGIVLASAGVACLSIGTFALPFFQVNLRLDLAAAIDALTAAANVGLIAGVVAFDLGFYAVIGATVAASVMNMLFALVLSARFWRPNVRFQPALAGPLLTQALPLGGVIVLGLLHFKLDAILLSLLKAPSDVGVYTVAYRFLEQSLVLPGLFIGVVFPLLTKFIARGDVRAAGDLIERALNFLLFLALPLAAALALFSEPLVHLVAPVGFDDAVIPLRILAFVLVVTYANTIFASLLLALDRQRVLLLVSAIGIVLNVGLNLYFIPRWSYTGAAVTTLISEIFGCAIVFALARHAYPFRLNADFTIRLVMATVLAGGTALVLSRYQLLIGAAVGGVTFAVASYAFGVVTRRDLLLVFGR